MQRLRRVLPLVFVGLGLLLLAIGALAFYVQRLAASPGAAPLPPQVAGQPLVSSRTGRAASLEIARMHQQSFPMNAAAVGDYRGEYEATLWVSEFPLAFMASRMTQAMVESMRTTPNLPFRLQGEQTIGEFTVYQAEGLGQQHFFFTAGNLVVWLAADEPIAAQALHDVLTFYRAPRP